MARYFFTDDAVLEGIWQVECRGRTRYQVTVRVPGCQCAARCGQPVVARDLLEAVAVVLYGTEVA